MTSEILIMTPSAIALAADSVVTIGERKTYTGVNKLFMLSNNPPMGIMTYNSSTFLDIPLETIIKEFRKNINENTSTLDDFKFAFKNFLEDVAKNEAQVYFERKTKFLIDNLKLMNQNFKTSQELKNYNKKKYNQNDKKIIRDILLKLDQSESFRKVLSDIKKNLKISDEFLDTIKTYLIDQTFLKEYTGIIIAGFEKDKLLPSYTEFQINYLYNSNAIILIKDDSEKIEGSKSSIKSFAQDDVIDNFLYNMDQKTEKILRIKFENIISDYTINCINNIIKIIKEKSNVDEKDIKMIQTEIQKGIISPNINFAAFCAILKHEHYESINKYIPALPKEELSNLAESLIKITSLKRKVQSDLETVGGPVDVAIITKGDGFIWTKHKHYFNNELNPQFLKSKL